MRKRLVASLFERIGATELILALRRRAPSPWLPILTFHRVREPDTDSRYCFDDGVIDSTPEQFDLQMSIVRRYFNPVGMDDVLRLAEGGSMPRNPVLITFDDGYRDNHEVAVPILKRHGIKAVFFIATSYIAERRVFWWDRINYLMKTSTKRTIEVSYPFLQVFDVRTPADKTGATKALLRLVKTHNGLDLDRLLDGLAKAADVRWDDELEKRFANEYLMTWDQVRDLRAAGMDVQSHTRTHRVLQTLDDNQIVHELRGSRDELEQQLDEPVRAISYPIGHTIRDRPFVRRALAAAGYKVGFTNDTGAHPLWRKFDPFEVNRIGVDLDMPTSLFRAMLAMPNVFQ
ncbi:MAG: polysaccharide deacetylase [Myxococcales bacterium]|nr:polysaccharide deacetylase [Myxococcales bacterium]